MSYLVMYSGGAETYIRSVSPITLTIGARRLGQATVVAPFIDGTANKIRSFANLAKGWHFGVGRAPASSTIASALAWHAQLVRLGFTTTDAFAGAEGEVMITAYEGVHYVELLIESLKVSLIYERSGIEKRHLEHANTEQASKALDAIAGEIWNTSAYYTQHTSTAGAASSRAWRSKYMTMGRQSSNLHVWSESLSATTCENFIAMSAANHRYFGSLTTPICLKVQA
jgi:hypothetical protein